MQIIGFHTQTDKLQGQYHLSLFFSRDTLYFLSHGFDVSLCALQLLWLPMSFGRTSLNPNSELATELLRSPNDMGTKEEVKPNFRTPPR
jgi:hypothetical protein